MCILSQSKAVLTISLLCGISAAFPASSHNAPYERRQTNSIYVPYYGTTANGFKAAARGWNSFGIDAANAQLKHDAGYDFNDYHFRQQCNQIQPRAGFDYICSIDSGWSQGCNGDANGIPIPDTSKIPDIKSLSDHLHSRGLKLGVYVLPGAFNDDKDKLVAGTNTRIGDIFNQLDVGDRANCRTNLNYSHPDAQKWHDSVIRKFATEFGIDFIKLDYVTPGSPDPGPAALPRDSSGSVTSYHKAIQNNNAAIRLDISWKLDRTEPYMGVWRAGADSLRVDQDINNSNEATLTKWATVMRTLDFYRQFINEQTTPARRNQPIQIRPDMDNSFVGNAQSISGLSDVERYSMAIHWIGAGANLITGSDMTRLDGLGKELLYNDEAMEVAAFTAQYPMQPRNPQGSPSVGGNEARQLQAWVAGPNEQGEAIVVLANYGQDPCFNGNGGCQGGVQNVKAALTDLGLNGNYQIRRIWGGGGSGGGDHTGPYGINGGVVECNLGPRESVLYKLTKA